MYYSSGNYEALRARASPPVSMASAHGSSVQAWPHWPALRS